MNFPSNRVINLAAAVGCALLIVVAIVYFQNSGTIDGFKVQQTQNFTGGTMKLYGLA